MTFHFVVKSLSDLVNESLTLSEEDAVAAASVATSSRLSPSGSASTSPHTTTATSTSPTPTTAATATGTTTTAFPRLSSLASEAIDDLPSVKLLKRLQPPPHKLIAITKSMNHHLTSLLVSFMFILSGSKLNKEIVQTVKLTLSLFKLSANFFTSFFAN